MADPRGDALLEVDAVTAGETRAHEVAVVTFAGGLNADEDDEFHARALPCTRRRGTFDEPATGQSGSLVAVRGLWRPFDDGATT